MDIFKIELIEIDEKRCRILRLRMRNDQMLNGTMVLQKLKCQELKMTRFENKTAVKIENHKLKPFFTFAAS